MSRQKKMQKTAPAERPNYRDLARGMLESVAKAHPQLGPLDFRLVLSALAHARAEGKHWANITRKDG